MADFKPGDTVRVKSGGPSMTVARIEIINGVENAVCGWFSGGDKNPKKEIGTFPLVMLTRAGS